MKLKDYIEAVKDGERRFVSATPLTRAADNETRTIEGVAAVVNQRTSIGWFNEELMPSAFINADQSDVRCLGNHQADLILGRTTNGSLVLKVDANGDLRYSCTMPNTTIGADWLENIRSGLITQSSFAFTVKRDDWIERKGEKPLRQIYEVEQLLDVSPVTYPAYQGTRVSARCLQHQQNPMFSDFVKRQHIYYELLLNNK